MEDMTTIEQVAVRRAAAEKISKLAREVLLSASQGDLSRKGGRGLRLDLVWGDLLDRLGVPMVTRRHHEAAAATLRRVIIELAANGDIRLAGRPKGSYDIRTVRAVPVYFNSESDVDWHNFRFVSVDFDSDLLIDWEGRLVDGDGNEWLDVLVLSPKWKLR